MMLWRAKHLHVSIVLLGHALFRKREKGTSNLRRLSEDWQAAVSQLFYTL